MDLTWKMEKSFIGGNHGRGMSEIQLFKRIQFVVRRIKFPELFHDFFALLSAASSALLRFARFIFIKSLFTIFFAGESFVWIHSALCFYFPRVSREILITQQANGWWKHFHRNQPQKVGRVLIIKLFRMRCSRCRWNRILKGIEVERKQFCQGKVLRVFRTCEW